MTTGVISTYRSAAIAPPRAAQLAYRAAVIIRRAAARPTVRRTAIVAGVGLVAAVAMLAAAAAMLTYPYDGGGGALAALCSVWAMQAAAVMTRQTRKGRRSDHE